MWKVALSVITVSVFVIADGLLSEGIDTADEITDKAYRCLKSTNLKHITLRVFANGTIDEVGYRNLRKVNGSINVNSYVVPSVFEDPARQIEDLVGFAKKHGWNHARIYIQITDPSKWSRNVEENVHFIQGFAKAAQAKKIKTVYLTNWYDYKIITGNSKDIPDGDLWYWETYGVGPEAQSVNDFSDFRPFGPFQSSPIAKQYSLQEKYCGLNANKYVYASKFAESTVSVLGGKH